MAYIVELNVTAGAIVIVIVIVIVIHTLLLLELRGDGYQSWLWEHR